MIPSSIYSFCKLTLKHSLCAFESDNFRRAKGEQHNGKCAVFDDFPKMNGIQKVGSISNIWLRRWTFRVWRFNFKPSSYWLACYPTHYRILQLPRWLAMHPRQFPKVDLDLNLVTSTSPATHYSLHADWTFLRFDLDLTFNFDPCVIKNYSVVYSINFKEAIWVVADRLRTVAGEHLHSQVKWRRILSV